MAVTSHLCSKKIWTEKKTKGTEILRPKIKKNKKRVKDGQN
jgi:hypothetical protein